jgi:hypothetical protein
VTFRAVRPVDGPACVVGIALATNSEVACFVGRGGWRRLQGVSGCSQELFWKRSFRTPPGLPSTCIASPSNPHRNRKYLRGNSTALR